MQMVCHFQIKVVPKQAQARNYASNAKQVEYRCYDANGYSRILFWT